MTYKILNGHDPSYSICLISENLIYFLILSHNVELLSDPRVKKKSAGCRAFSYCARFPWLTLLRPLKTDFCFQLVVNSLITSAMYLLPFFIPFAGFSNNFPVFMLKKNLTSLCILLRYVQCNIITLFMIAD